MMEEVQKVLRMLDEVYAVFGLSYTAALSTRPDSFLGEAAVWDQAEAALRDALDAVGKEWEVSPFRLDVLLLGGLSRRGPVPQSAGSMCMQGTRSRLTHWLLGQARVTGMVKCAHCLALPCAWQ